MGTDINQDQDLIISGSGKAVGGEYQTVDISGSGRVNGDIKCEKYRISGSAKIDGNVMAETMKISGSSHHYGNIETEYIEVSGSTSVDGHAACADASVGGSLKIGKHLSGEKVEVSGSIKVNESCAVETFKVKGSFKIGGLLNADNIDITLYHDSSAREIGGSIIHVERGHKGSIIGKLISGFYNTLTADIIEGDEVFLENTKAKIVRGKNVRIGEGCNIDLVEYTDDYQNEGNAQVKDLKKL